MSALTPAFTAPPEASVFRRLLDNVRWHPLLLSTTRTGATRSTRRSPRVRRRHHSGRPGGPPRLFDKAHWPPGAGTAVDPALCLLPPPQKKKYRLLRLGAASSRTATAFVCLLRRQKRGRWVCAACPLEQEGVLLKTRTVSEHLGASAAQQRRASGALRCSGAVAALCGQFNQWLNDWPRSRRLQQVPIGSPAEKSVCVCTGGMPLQLCLHLECVCLSL